MRTTVEITDRTYAELEARAASLGSSVKDLIHEAVDAFLLRPSQHNERRNPFPVIRSGNPGSLAIDNERIFDDVHFP